MKYKLGKVIIMLATLMSLTYLHWVSSEVYPALNDVSEKKITIE